VVGSDRLERLKILQKAGYADVQAAEDAARLKVSRILSLDINVLLHKGFDYVTFRERKVDGHMLVDIRVTLAQFCGFEHSPAELLP
jgi:hypothetical protein